MKKIYPALYAIAICLCAGCENDAIQAEEDQNACDACSKSECIDATNLNACRDDNGDGCKEWIKESCDDGVCTNGQCVAPTPSCNDACTTDTCGKDGKLYKCRDDNGDGCKEAIAEDCPNGLTCTAGECVSSAPSCQDTCDDGTECDGDSSYKTCADHNGDGCKTWSASTPCAPDHICQGGTCVKKEVEPTCTDSCSGAPKCDGDKQYSTCMDKDGDGCKEWSTSACDSGTKCDGGSCVCKYAKVDNVGTDMILPDEGHGKSESTNANGFNDEYIYDATNQFKLGVRKEWGGTVVFFGQAGSNSSNTIDSNDTGREVQLAVYDLSRLYQNCAYNASCWTGTTYAPHCGDANTYLGWNPVQGGNQCNIGSGIDSISNKDGVLKISVTPLQWNPDWDAKDCTDNGCNTSLKNRKADVIFTQTFRFINSLTVEIVSSVTNIGTQDHVRNVQEFPTVYTAYGAHGLGNYDRFWTANNTEIQMPDDSINLIYEAQEPWIAAVNADKTYGMGILYENGVTSFSLFRQSKVFNSVRSNMKFGIPVGTTVKARSYIMLGNYNTIASLAGDLQKKIPPFGVLDAPADGVNVSGETLVSGWAVDNHGVTKVVARIDESTEYELDFGSPRPDVCKVWVGYPQCDNVGFAKKISFDGLNKSCPHLIEIIATDTDGNKRTIARRVFNVK